MDLEDEVGELKKSVQALQLILRTNFMDFKSLLEKIEKNTAPVTVEYNEPSVEV